MFSITAMAAKKPLSELDLQSLTAEKKAETKVDRIPLIDYSKEVVTVVRVAVEKTRITLPEYAEIMKIKEPPLTKCRVVVELKGVATAVASALRRAPLGEVQGRSLYIHAFRDEAADKKAADDPFMVEEVLSTRIRCIPLRFWVPDSVVRDARFRLFVTNDTESTKTVMSGDLTIVSGVQPEKKGAKSRGDSVLFNPTIELAFIQPGHCLRVHDIRIREGYGRQGGEFRVACLGTLRHLDIKEAPRAETHTRGGARADESGYLESTLIADPRHHEVGVTVPATGPDPNEAVAVMLAACTNIIDRLRIILSALKDVVLTSGEKDPAKGGEGVQFTLISQSDGSEGVLWVGGETHTVGNLLKRMIFELNPAVGFVDYTSRQHENGIRVTVRDKGDVVALVRRGLERGIATFEKIHTGIRDARVEVL
ncbi:MAG: hypothetical protein KGL39_10460 [Patescibacteria group bacterium]|nr:hypothetical protein [Patescibacteria group bacterium]